jgi:hypothetical protein
MRARRRGHVGAMRSTAFEAFERPHMAAFESTVRLDPHDARRATACFTLRTGEDLLL